MSRRPFPNIVNWQFIIYSWSVLKIPHPDTDKSLISYGQTNQYIMYNFLFFLNSNKTTVYSVTQSCLTLCDTLDCSPPASSIQRIFQARILEWVAIFLSRGPPQSRDQIRVSCIFCIGRWILYHCTTWEANKTVSLIKNKMNIYHLVVYYLFVHTTF